MTNETFEFGAVIIEVTDKERIALDDARRVFGDNGIAISLPWDGSLSDVEKETFKALVEACRAYRDALR